MADESTNQGSGDPIAVYANNVYFESSAWDLKIIFGQIDQSTGTVTVKQKVAVTIPWTQAKLTLFWLRVQVELIERQSGKIAIRNDLVPPEWPAPTGGQKDDPDAIAFFELYNRARDEFLKTI
jgi:hypothetical protein